MRTICCVIFFLLLSFPAFGLGSEQPRFIWIEPGDSYIALFGKSWLPVFQANSSLKFLNSSGKLNHNPEKLVIGSKLFIPEGSTLTERAVKRMNKYKVHITQAELSIREAENFAATITMKECQSEACLQGIALLKKARNSAKGDTSYGYSNFLEATELSKEALKLLKIASQIQQNNADIKSLNNKIETEKIATRRKIDRQRLQHGLFIGIMSSMALGSILFIRHKANSEKSKINREWLKQQQDRLKNMEGSTF